jgi:mannose-1-phosphate guanylyltransferase
MRAVVLVGGFGTRLRPLTLTRPKQMLPIVNRPMIEHVVGHLADHGVDDVVLSLGYRPDGFRRAYPEGRCAGATLHYAVEPEPLDTAGAIRFAADRAGIDDTFVVVNGDVLTELDLADLVAAHRAAGADATIHLTAVDDPSAFGVADVDRSGRVLKFVEKPAPGTEPSNLINAGTYVFEPSVLDLIEPGRPVSVERDTFPRLVAGGRMYAVATDDYWIDAGRPELYLRANLDLVTGRRRDCVKGVHPAAKLGVDVAVEDAVIGPGASVGAGAVVNRSVLLPGASVGAGAVVEESIVMGSAGARARVVRAVVGAGAIILDDESVVDARVPESVG